MKKNPSDIIFPPEGKNWLEFLEENKLVDIENLNSSKFLIEEREEDNRVARSLVDESYYPELRKRYDILGYTLNPPFQRTIGAEDGAVLLFNKDEERRVWFHMPLSYLETLLGIDFSDD